VRCWQRREATQRQRALPAKHQATIPSGSDPRIQPMVARYLFIDTIQLVNIFKNKFRAVNIFKLINDHISNSVSKQVFAQHASASFEHMTMTSLIRISKA